MIANLKSTFRIAALSLALAFGMTAGQAIVQPVPAQAGVIGKIGGAVKGAAKAVGGGVKKAAIGVGSASKKVGVAVGSAGKKVGVAVGSAGKKVGVAVGTAGKRVGVGVGTNVAKAAKVVGKYAAKTPPVRLEAGVAVDEVYVVAGHKGQPAAVAKRGGSGGGAAWRVRRDAARGRRTSRPSSG